MSEERIIDRITIQPGVMTGKPVVRGTRLTVEYVLGLLASGAGMEEILDEYDGLEIDDIKACLEFARSALSKSAFLSLES